MTHPTDTKDALLACPFCGASEAIAVPPTCNRKTPYDASHRAYPIVECRVCNSRACGANWDESCESAIAAWNRRATIGQEDGWVNCNDRLPAQGQEIIGCNADNDTWYETFDVHEPLGAMVCWIRAPRKILHIAAAPKESANERAE